METINRRQLIHGILYTGAGLAAATAFPEPAEAQLIRMVGADKQKEVGQQAAQQILAKYKEVKDGRADKFKAMGQRLVDALPASDRSKWDFNFRVLDSDEVNAFALPGGPMFMYTGLFKRLGTEDALAAVTGHEMAHVYKEHWAKANRKQQERQLGIAAILALGKVGQLGQTVAGLADSALTSKFTRGEEDEADKLGLQNLVSANYNPEGMVQLFQTLQKLSGNGGSGPLGDFMSDHPLTSARINNARKRIAEYEGKRNFPATRPLNYNALAAR